VRKGIGGRGGCCGGGQDLQSDCMYRPSSVFRRPSTSVPTWRRDEPRYMLHREVVWSGCLSIHPHDSRPALPCPALRRLALPCLGLGWPLALCSGRNSRRQKPLRTQACGWGRRPTRALAGRDRGRHGGTGGQDLIILGLVRLWASSEVQTRSTRLGPASPLRIPTFTRRGLQADLQVSQCVACLRVLPWPPSPSTSRRGD
jgi:hypothetical protein